MSRTTARERILAAAAEVAREQGAGNLSLDAVAARAGVSKGGLLYHFPTKSALMRATVETWIAAFEARLEETAKNDPARLLPTFVHLTLEDCAKPDPGASGVLAAIAEDPDFLKPIKAFQRRLLDRLLADGPNPDSALLVYLALEGLRSLRLFDFDILTPAELDRARAAMLEQAMRP